jgi:TonB dependent receptor/Carboxypeptidase regulatory-like domain/TonB-dependent Receptor Plug Domain
MRWPVAALLVSMWCCTAAQAAERIVLKRDLPMELALSVLRSHGLRLIYSTALVTDSLRVSADVEGDDPVALAREILKPHGLRIRSLGGGLSAIVVDRSQARQNLSGRVVDDAHAPIRGARVEIAGQHFMEWTEATGEFSLPVSGIGTRTLRISAAGFEPATVSVVATVDGSWKVEIQLQPETADLEQITVVASRFTYREEAASSFALSQSAIIAQPKIAEDALQAVAKLPGMAFSGVSAKPNVRGGEVGETLVRLDGMPIREAYHLRDYNSAFSVLDENLVAQLSTYTGPLPARYGNRLAAVVDVDSVATDQPSRRAVALSNFNARVRVGSSSKDESNLHWLASARVGTLGRWLQNSSPDIGRPSSTDVFVKAEQRVGSSDFRAQTLLSKSVFDFLDPQTGEHARLKGAALYGWLSTRHEIDERLTLGTLVGYSVIDSHRSGQVAGGLTVQGAAQDDRSSHIWDAQVFGNLQLTAHQHLEAGLAMASSHGHYQYSSEVEFVAPAVALFAIPLRRSRSSDVSVERDMLGVFVADKWQPFAHAYVEVGARLDRDLASGSFRSSHFSPRVAARWDVTPLTTLRASWGRAFQVPEAHELRVEDGELTLPKAQRVDQTVLSIEQMLGNGLALRVEGFERHMPNPRTRYENIFDPLRLLPELSADRIATSPSRSRMQGLEATAEWQLGSWSLWGAYSWSQAFDVVSGQSRARDWDQRTSFSAALSWQSGPWSAAVQGAYRSGRPTTPIVSTALNAPLLGARNSARFAAHMTVDARVSRRFALGSGSLLAFAQVTNLTNRKNLCCTELDLPDESSNPLFLEIQSLRSYPLVPAVGISYEF